MKRPKLGEVSALLESVSSKVQSWVSMAPKPLFSSSRGFWKILHLPVGGLRPPLRASASRWCLWAGELAALPWPSLLGVRGLWKPLRRLSHPPAQAPRRAVPFPDGAVVTC